MSFFGVVGRWIREKRPFLEDGSGLPPGSHWSQYTVTVHVLGRKLSVGWVSSCEDHSLLVHRLIDADIPSVNSWANRSFSKSSPL